MATRSSIHSFDGETLTSVYCHWDGYPSHHAPILLEKINNADKVNELLSLGNIASLDDVTVLYGRDRGESDQEAEVTTIVNVDNNGLPTASSLPIREEYQYLYDLRTDTWYMMDGKSPWVKLTTDHYED